MNTDKIRALTMRIDELVRQGNPGKNALLNYTRRIRLELNKESKCKESTN